MPPDVSIIVVSKDDAADLPISLGSAVGQRGVACETILVDSFEIVVPGFSFWRAAMWTSLLVLVAGVAVHFMLPYRPYPD